MREHCSFTEEIDQLSIKMSNIGNVNFVKPNEVKREEFRKYLEHAGIMEAFSNVLTSLYKEHERPDDAFEYVRKHFAISDANRSDSLSEIETLKKELAEAKAKIAELEDKLSKYESENTA